MTNAMTNAIYDITIELKEIKKELQEINHHLKDISVKR